MCVYGRACMHLCVVGDPLTGDLLLHTPSFLPVTVSGGEEQHVMLVFHKQNDVFSVVSDGQFQSLHSPHA